MNVFVITNEDSEIICVIEPNVNSLREALRGYYEDRGFELQYVDCREFTYSGSFSVNANIRDPEDIYEKDYSDLLWVDNFLVQ